MLPTHKILLVSLQLLSACCNDMVFPLFLYLFYGKKRVPSMLTVLPGTLKTTNRTIPSFQHIRDVGTVESKERLLVFADELSIYLRIV